MSNESITECLFYRSYRSFLLQAASFRTEFEILLDQYSSCSESFKILSRNDVLRLKNMQEAFKTGKYTLFEGITADFLDKPLPEINKSELSHKNFVREIYEHRENSLIPFTGPIDEVCPEYPVLDGSIDLMARSGPCAYAVEVKTETAGHDIVGQVMKYFVGLSLKLSLKFFNEVKMITICPGYDRSAVSGLLQIGALPLLIEPRTMKVSQFS